ncbi:hypothetical protein OG607_40855 [Streptomyces sp. NBC_01537]|uniref:hypothetical protein n=1 Tax=Streptomyces sp. NBC_01537 TaxID=2903896 RepID=UPI00386E5133
MAILVINRGAEWTQELYQTVFDRTLPDPAKPPAGLIAHFAAPGEAGGWQVIDVWESEDALRYFMEETVLPAAQEFGAPPFDSKVVELYNSLIP